jgi:hypothetical protein
MNIEDSNMSEGDGRTNEDGREIERLENLLRETRKVRDSWCAEFVKCRDALRKIYDETEGWADGSEDASQHDLMCNQISGIVLETLGLEGLTGCPVQDNLPNA